MTDDTFTLLADALELPASYDLRPGTRIEDVPGWDSYGWITVITLFEERYGTEFPLDEIERVKVVGEFIEIVAQLRQA